jgi:hypothetical protein
MSQFDNFQFNTQQYNDRAFLAAVNLIDAIVVSEFSLSDGTKLVCTNVPNCGPTDRPRGRRRAVDGRGFCHGPLVILPMNGASTHRVKGHRVRE